MAPALASARRHIERIEVTANRRRFVARFTLGIPGRCQRPTGEVGQAPGVGEPVGTRVPCRQGESAEARRSCCESPEERRAKCPKLTGTHSGPINCRMV
jgi:hypothetical protein